MFWCAEPEAGPECGTIQTRPRPRLCSGPLAAHLSRRGVQAVAAEWGLQPELGLMNSAVDRAENDRVVFPCGSWRRESIQQRALPAKFLRSFGDTAWWKPPPLAGQIDAEGLSSWRPFMEMEVPAYSAPDDGRHLPISLKSRHPWSI